jgi:hypothetical protein
MAFRHPCRVKALRKLLKAQSSRRRSLSSYQTTAPTSFIDELPQKSKLKYLQDNPVQSQLVYRMLQLFCEGHNDNMQNLLSNHSSTSGVKSGDLIGTAMVHLNQFCKTEEVFSTYSTEDDLKTMEALLDFLIDSMQVSL